MRAVSRFAVNFIFVLVSAMPVMAQAQSNVRSNTADDQPSAGGPRRQLATIIYSGLGGAVLGLSTLSFYGRPQDKLSNIAVGFAVGVITGTIAVTYSAATNPDEFYGLQNRDDLLGPGLNQTALAHRDQIDPLGSHLFASRWEF